MKTHDLLSFCNVELTLQCFCMSVRSWKITWIIIRSSLNLHKTSIIALDGLQVWSIPIRRECSIPTAPWPRIPARSLLFLSAVCPAGPQGANQMADWVSTVSREYGELLSSLPPLFKFCKELHGNKRGAQKRSSSTRSARRETDGLCSAAVSAWFFFLLS